MSIGPIISYVVMDRAVALSKLIFDLGANDGGFSATYARSGAIVHAYEPVPSMFEKVTARPGVIAHPVAVSDRNGRLEKINVFNTWTLLPEDSPKDRAVEFAKEPPFSCDVTTVDDEVALYGLPDFIKVDVDGYELRVLKGALRTLILAKPPMMFEYSYLPTFLGDSIEEMVYLIYGLGYRAWSMDGMGCAETAQEMLSEYPAHTSFDIMLIHRDRPV